MFKVTTDCRQQQPAITSSLRHCTAHCFFALWMIFEDDVTLSTLLDEVGQSRTPVPTEQVAGGDRELDNVVDRLLHDSICWVACLGFEI